MKCLVTGATGFVGRELCKQLSLAGHEVLAYSRTGEDLENGTPTRAVDFRNATLDAQQLAGVELVFHLAGIAHQQAAAEDYESVNHVATLNLARQAEAAGVRCFVFLSSVKAMGEGSAGAIVRSESDSVRPLDHYGLSKWMAETALNDEFCRRTMAVCVLRPALVYGTAAKGNLASLAKAVSRGLPRPPEAGGRSMIAVEDLCALMLHISWQCEAGVRTYIVSDGEQYSLRRIYDAMRRVQGLGPGRAWCPRWMWRVACSLLDWLRPRNAPRWETLFGYELYSNEQLLRATSWRPQRSLENTLSPEAGHP